MFVGLGFVYTFQGTNPHNISLFYIQERCFKPMYKIKHKKQNTKFNFNIGIFANSPTMGSA